MLLNGCFTSRSFVNFEVLQPAVITYPESVHNIGYLNRAPLSKYSFYEKNQINLDQVSLLMVDSMICNNLKKGFLEARKDTELPYLDFILTMESRRRDTVNRSSQISELYRNDLFKKHNLDALIVLEYYKLKLEKSGTNYSYSYRDYIQEYSFAAEVFWRIYVRGSENTLNEFTNADTLYYVNSRSSPDSLRWNTVGVIQNGFYEIGYSYGQKHIPVWNNVLRIMFRGKGSTLRNAARYTDTGDWESALQIWTSLSENEDARISAMARNNIAIYYELEDEIPTALEYAQSALDLWENETIEAYVQELKIRLENQEDIYKQYRQ